jgi:Clostripain family
VATYVAQTLTLNELRDALAAAKRYIHKPLEIVAFKDCFMSTLETVAQLADLATHVVASQSLVPAENWPYREIFKGLLDGKDRTESAKRFAAALEKHYALKENRENNADVPYTLLDTRRMRHVGRQLAKLVARLNATKETGGNAKALQNALARAALGNEKALVDVKVFCDELNKYSDALVRNYARVLASALPSSKNTRGLVVSHSGGKAASGVSLFCFPSDPKAQKTSNLASNSSSDAYKALEMSEATHWDTIAFQARPSKPTTRALRALPETGQPMTRDVYVEWMADQLQQQGAAERLQLETINFLQHAIILGKGFNLDKGFNLGKGFNLDKGFNLAKGFNLSIAVAP